jgi:sugar transferase (PEP-CTERM/EpsH1 system associated)
MRYWVNDVLRTVPLQKILAFSGAMAQYVMSAKHVRRVVDLVDVDSEKWRQYAAAQSWPASMIYRRESKALLQYERHIASQFDATVFVSEAEARLFRERAPEAAHKVWHMNNGVDSDYFSPERVYVNPYDDGDRIVVFTGAMDYWPNIDAVVWFARTIFPEVRRRVPAAKFYIVGTQPAPEVRRLADLPGVLVTGAVPDIRPYLAHAAIAVAPLRVARGIQNKVLEAMSMAKPVLASPQAAEGLEVQIGVDLMVAADEKDFAQQTCRLLDSGSAASIGRAGRARVFSSYTWEGSLSRLDRLLSGSMSPADARSGRQSALSIDGELRVLS